MADPEAELIADGDEAPASPVSGARRNIWPWVLLGVVTSFAIGLLGSPWLAESLRGRSPPAAVAEAPADAAHLTAIDQRLRKLEAPAAGRPVEGAAVDSADFASRLQALEARLGQEGAVRAGVLVDLQQLADDLQRARQLVEDSDSQTRDLFLLSLARRMVAAGRPLDAVEPLLLARFRGRDATATDALLAWSGEPQTRETLASRLPELEAASSALASSASWWARLQAGLGQLVRVHDPADPEQLSVGDRLAAAAVALRRDDLGLAIRQVDGMQHSAVAGQWVHDARLLAEAEGALDRLDMLALAATTAGLARELPPRTTAG